MKDENAGYNEGNNYAEKWTEEKVLGILAEAKRNITKSTYLIRQAIEPIFERLGYDYYNELWAYWSDKFKDNKNVFKTIKSIEDKIEANLVLNSLGGEVKETTAIFLLKAKYKYNDKAGTEINYSSQDTNVVPVLSFVKKRNDSDK